jgi:V/A-type H+-transporting ATPase subunit A
MLKFYDKALHAVNQGVPAREIAEIMVKDDIARLKYVEEKDVDKAIKEIEIKMEEQINALIEKMG